MTEHIVGSEVNSTSLRGTSLHNETVSEEAVRYWTSALLRSGAIGSSLIGVQYDLNPAWRNVDGSIRAASFCDKNCTTELGNYTCLAASSLNRGIQPKTLTPAARIIDSFHNLQIGIEEARGYFFNGPFQQYCEKFQIPPAVAAAMRLALDQPGFEINMFGGNPELHPGVINVMQSLTQAGHTVHLTTTGGRFTREPHFRAQIVENPPALVAFSADDFESAADIRHLDGLTYDQLRQAWRATPAQHGQRRKAIEAVYATKLAQETEGFPPIIFNMVLHAGNLEDAYEMIAALVDAFPQAKINPFPAQSAFAYSGNPALSPKYAQTLRTFIDQMIEAQATALKGNGKSHPFVPRLHYWLMLRSVFDWAGSDDARAIDMITGNGIWRCYNDASAGLYMQVGLGSDGQVRSSETQHPGGCLGCFWNRDTVTDDRQVWSETMAPEAITQYIRVGKRALAAASAKPCPGCAFPRLTSHIISTETGMNPELVPFYLVRRMEMLGF